MNNKFIYPCLVHHHELVVRADRQTSDNTFAGVVMESDKNLFPSNPVGSYNYYWDIDSFEPYETK